MYRLPFEFIQYLFDVSTHKRTYALIETQKRYYEKNKKKHTEYVREWRNKKKQLQS